MNEFKEELEQIGKIPDTPPPEYEELFRKFEKAITTPWKDVEIDDSEYLDPTSPFEPPEFAISIHDKPVFAFDDFNYLSGQAGNGKSFTILIYESVILGKPFGGIKYIGKRKKPKILHIDTEQSKGNVQLHQKRLYHMVGWEQGSDHRDQYEILQLRDTPSAQKRWAKVLKACMRLKPDFVIVDGMLDVVKSMNDEEECSRVISEAIALANILKCCEIGICHENPRNPKSDDGPDKPAGHIGSFSQRKASAGQSTKKKLVDGKPNMFVNSRKVRNEDYEGFCFGIRKEEIVIGEKSYQIAIPYWIDTNTEEDEQQENDDVRKIRDYMLNITWSIEGLRYTDIENGLKHQGITSKRKLSDYIVLAQEYGLVKKNTDTKRYFLLYDQGATIDNQSSIDYGNSIGDDISAPF